MQTVNGGYSYVVVNSSWPGSTDDLAIGSFKPNAHRFLDLSDVEKIVTFQNRTPSTIYVTDSDDMTVELPPPEEATVNGGLWVMVTYKGTHEALQRMAEILMEQPDDTPHIRAWIDKLRSPVASKSKVKGAKSTARMHYRIDADELKEVMGRFPDEHYRLYMPEVNMLFEWRNPSLGKDTAVSHMPHPYGRISRALQESGEQMPVHTSQSAIISFRGVDNNSAGRVMDSRYINIGGEVFEIPMERGPGNSGIHVTSRLPIDFTGPAPNGSSRSEGFITKEYSFAEAEEKFHLHRTAEAALRGGTAQDHRKTLLQERHDENLILVQELKNKQLRMEEAFERERAEVARQQLEKDIELQELNRQLKAERYHSDRSASKAKEGDSWMKFLIGIFTGGLALIMTVLKLRAAT